MKFKNKGREIYKTKEKNYYVKSKSSRIMSLCLSLMLVGGIVFVGYSVAEPILNYTKKQGDIDVSTSENNLEYPSTNTSETAGFTESSVISEEKMNKTIYKCASLNPESLTSTEKLRTALAEIKMTDAEYVAVPLKVSGGKIYYFTDNGESYLSGAVVSQLTLENILTEINGINLKSIAYFSVLEDNIYPATYPDASFKTADDGSIWIDNNIEDGGKPWLSPFSDTAITYVKSLANEVTKANFDKIIFSDITFPPFRQSDLDYIGATVTDTERYTILVSLANELYANSLNNGTSVMLEISASDILSGRAEVLQPMLLSISTIVLDINFDELYSINSPNGMLYEFTGTPAEKTLQALNFVKSSLSDYNIVIRLSGETVTDSELEEAKKVIQENGYQSYILR